MILSRLLDESLWSQFKLLDSRLASASSSFEVERCSNCLASVATLSKVRRPFSPTAVLCTDALACVLLSCNSRRKLALSIFFVTS